MEEKVKISIMLDIYGKMLTEKQFQLLDDYYNNDLSLSEIAENEGITRQAVRDNLKKGENNLLDFESKLAFMKKSELQEQIVNETIELLENGNVEKAKEKLKKLI